MQQQGHPEEVYGCEFVEGDGNSLQLVTGSSENVYLWDVATATRLAEAGPPSDLRDIAGGKPLPRKPISLCMSTVPHWPFNFMFKALVMGFSG